MKFNGSSVPQSTLIVRSCLDRIISYEWNSYIDNLSYDLPMFTLDFMAFWVPVTYITLQAMFMSVEHDNYCTLDVSMSTIKEYLSVASCCSNFVIFEYDFFWRWDVIIEYGDDLYHLSKMRRFDKALSSCCFKSLDQLWAFKYFRCDRKLLTGGNWQKWKRVFLTCSCHEICRDEAVGLKSCKNTWKITIFVKMWNLGQYRENLIFCQ